MKIIVLKGLVAALCVGICGCSMLKPDPDLNKCDDSRSYPYWTEWENGELISIVNDSIAAVKTRKFKIECISEINKEDIVSFRAGLFLINYRVKQKPLLGDTLTSEYSGYSEYSEYSRLTISSGALVDSSVLVFDLKNKKFGFWKVGEKSIKFNPNEVRERFESVDGVNRWVNKSIIFRKFNYLDWFVLDAEKGQIKPFEPSKEYEWVFPKEQNDYNSCFYGSLAYIEDKAVCTRINCIEQPCYSELVVDGIVTDTIRAEINSMSGNYVKLRFPAGKVLKIDTKNFKFDKNFVLYVRGNNSEVFYNDGEYFSDSVSYSGQDLIGTIKN
ncbi:MAG: hypothetical protein LBC87_04690 [Fibromonadaceae bacterium]|nr:hypothetical protein [Fibromonadaceae bacterium]